MAQILLIDDDRLLLTALPAVFQHGSQVIAVDTASNAEQALRMMEDVDYDVIVSDFSMPGLNGIDFLKECSMRRPNTPVVLMTGYGTHELEEEALKEGAYALVQKPVDANFLYSVVTCAIIRGERRHLNLFNEMPSQGQIFAIEKDRLSSRLREIDDRLKKQIESARQKHPE